MTQFPFDLVRTTQAAARLIAGEGGEISYMKLIKLLYLADRHALSHWGMPITGDHYVSMKRGPVLSTVLDIIHEGDQEGYWSRFITAPEKYCVRLQCPAPDSELSPAECDLLDHLSRRFRKHDRWQMVDVVHTLPEWRDPGDSAIPISYEDILRATCKPDDVDARITDIDHAARMHSLLALPANKSV